jgi:hypothetical protein
VQCITHVSPIQNASPRSAGVDSRSSGVGTKRSVPSRNRWARSACARIAKAPRVAGSSDVVGPRSKDAENRRPSSCCKAVVYAAPRCRFMIGDTLISSAMCINLRGAWRTCDDSVLCRIRCCVGAVNNCACMCDLGRRHRRRSRSDDRSGAAAQKAPQTASAKSEISVAPHATVRTTPTRSTATQGLINRLIYLAGVGGLGRDRRPRAPGRAHSP